MLFEERWCWVCSKAHELALRGALFTLIFCPSRFGRGLYGLLYVFFPARRATMPRIPLRLRDLSSMQGTTGWPQSKQNYQETKCR
jgi:hypothetical protein